MMFTIFDRLSAHLEKSEKPLAHKLIIICSLNRKGLHYRPSPPNYAKYFLETLGL